MRRRETSEGWKGWNSNRIVDDRYTNNYSAYEEWSRGIRGYVIVGWPNSFRLHGIDGQPVSMKRAILERDYLTVGQSRTTTKSTCSFFCSSFSVFSLLLVRAKKEIYNGSRRKFDGASQRRIAMVYHSIDIFIDETEYRWRNNGSVSPLELFYFIFYCEARVNRTVVWKEPSGYSELSSYFIGDSAGWRWQVAGCASDSIFRHGVRRRKTTWHFRR